MKRKAGKRPKVEKNYNPATFNSDSAKALARALAGKGKYDR